MTADSLNAAPGRAAGPLVFVACAEDGVIDVLELDPADGTLGEAAPRAAAPKIRALAVAPEGYRIYAALSDTPGRIAAYDVDPHTGALSAAGSGTVPAPQCYLSIDRTGRFLFGASYHGHQVTVSAVDDNGHLAGPELEQQEPGRRAHAVLPSPDNSFVYATSLGSDRIVAYHFDQSTGRIVPASSVQADPDSGPRHLRFSAVGDRVYVLHEMSGDVAVYQRDAGTGELAELQKIASVPEDLGLIHGRMREPGKEDPGPEAIWCADLRLSLDGRFLYTTERSSSTISSFAVDAEDGTLRYLDTVPTERQPRGINIDPSGNFLLACGELSGSVTVYRIGPDGTLTVTDRRATGAGPLWIEFLSR